MAKELMSKEVEIIDEAFKISGSQKLTSIMQEPGVRGGRTYFSKTKS